MTKNEMIALKNSLSDISTKGDDTIKMANCLKFISRKIIEADIVPEEAKSEEASIEDEPKSEETPIEEE